MYWSPYAKYLRDTLSYIALVALHYALCLSSSTIAFSKLEWVILVFFMGRYLVECQQIWNTMQRIKQRGKNDDVGDIKRNKTKWTRLKTLSIYLRYIVFVSIRFFGWGGGLFSDTIKTMNKIMLPWLLVS